ncbi:amino acid permease [Asanoa iriomotensis]|uniref:Amino acid permease n=1 Tax=Asanoa iriomotensis TaxID=234613 RepID=A0ABQ4C5D3_9ACTN|nr:amino acid permease [Asanoa iriomotensis]
MTAVYGGIGSALNLTGNSGIAFGFVGVTVALLLFTNGYVAVARDLVHTAPLYAQNARGVGPVFGGMTAATTLFSYNAIQVCLYGLIGVTLSGKLGLLPWWGWALAVWAAIAVLGMLHVRASATVLMVLLAVEVLVVVAFVMAALAAPADGSTDLSPLLPSALFDGGGVSSVLALVIASFIGWEISAAFGEEARSERAVAVATFAAALFIGLLLTASAVAMVNADPHNGVPPSGELVFTTLDAVYGTVVFAVASILLITSIIAAGLSFHQTAARYGYALSRDGLLPRWLGRVRATSGVPVGGSLAQSVIGLVTIAGSAAAGASPDTLFGWGAGAAALGLLSTMAATCVSHILFFRRGHGRPVGVWTRLVAPVLGAAVMVSVVILLLAQNTVPALPYVLVGCAVAGGARAAWVVRHRPAARTSFGAPSNEFLETGGRFASAEARL